MVISIRNRKLTLSYLSIMIIASFITLARGFLIAGILNTSSFGIYVTIIAIGMFLSIILSMGSIEKTTKTFPRLWLIQEQCYQIISLTNSLQKKIAVRFVIFLIVILLCDYLYQSNSFFELAPFSLLVALSVSLNSLYASAIRATGMIELISRNTLHRALLALTFGLIGGFSFGWKGAILGETIGMMLGVLISRISTLTQINKHFTCNYDKSSSTEIDHIAISSSNNSWLFLSSLLISIPSYLDRVLINSVLGANVVGTLGFLMLFVTGANTFTGIIAQKIGPQIVKMEQIGASINTQLKYAFRWIILIWITCLSGMTIITLVLMLTPASFYLSKFNIDLNLIFVITFICLLQINTIADFILISRNCERFMFNASFGYIISFGIIALSLIINNFSLLVFLWLMAIAKLIHLTLQSHYIYKAKNAISK